MMTIQWIGQSGYILDDGDTEIIIDPYLSDVVNDVAGCSRLMPCPAEPGQLCPDVVVCTHDHLDHLDPVAISGMKKDTITFVCPGSCVKHLRVLGADNIVQLNTGDSVSFGRFTLTAVFADHTVEAIGLVVRHEGKTLYFSGDTYYHPRLESLAELQLDIACICINGKLGNMNADDAAKLTRRIQPRTGVPAHYGMFASNTEDPQRYVSQIDHGFIMEFNKRYGIDEIR